MDSSGGCWKITYSGVTTGGKFLEGSLVLSDDSWLVLLNAKGSPLEGRCLENGEQISIGSVLRFPLTSLVSMIFWFLHLDFLVDLLPSLEQMRTLVLNGMLFAPPCRLM